MSRQGHRIYRHTYAVAGKSSPGQPALSSAVSHFHAFTVPAMRLSNIQSNPLFMVTSKQLVWDS